MYGRQMGDFCRKEVGADICIVLGYQGYRYMQPLAYTDKSAVETV